MSPRILVTGASGTVGRETVRELVRRGVSVRAGVHTIGNFAGIADGNVEIFPFDWRVPSSIRALLKGVETAILITPVSTDQVEWATSFVDEARASGLYHLVRLSLLGADSVPGVTLTRLHREVEEHIESSGIHFTFLQPNTFMQNFIHHNSPSSGMLYMPLGESRTSYVDVTDLARAGAELLVNGRPHFGQTYTLTGPEALSMNDVASIFSKVLERHVSYISISDETAEHAIESQGVSRPLAKAMVELSADARNGNRSLVTRDIELVTGLKPRSFEEFSRAGKEELKAMVPMTAETSG